MSVYNTKIAGLSGQEDLLSSLKGSVTLVVNVASKCGLTPQYTALEALYEQYSAQGFRFSVCRAINLVHKNQALRAKSRLFAQQIMV